MLSALCVTHATPSLSHVPPPLGISIIFGLTLLSKLAKALDFVTSPRVPAPCQVIDTGLDESSCFFAHDESGDHVPHGYYYDEWGVNFDFSSLSDEPADDDNPRGRPDPESALSSTRRDRRPITSSTTTDFQYASAFFEGDFTVYPDRRKVRQGHVRR